MDPPSSRSAETQPNVAQRVAPARLASEPTVLVIGADDTFLPALRLALARHQVYVETSLMANAVETVVVTAPDLVLLVGEAAKESGREILRALSAGPVSSTVPVALLNDEMGLDVRLRAFRHGAAAVIPRSASVDAIAEQIAKVAREIPERGASLGVIGEATLSEFVNTLHNELRSGILSVQQAQGDAPVRLVLGGGRPLADFIDDFVRRVRRHVVLAEPLEYEFDDRAAGTVQLLASESLESEPPPGNIEGVRVVLADNHPVRVDVVAQELRARGATVFVCDFSPDPSHFARLRQMDPHVLMIGEAELQGIGYDLFKRLKADTRLRWASLLVVRWEELWENALAVPSIDRIRGVLAELCEPDRGLSDRAELGDAFDTRLEITGPSRSLRALTDSKRALRLSLHNTRVSVDIDVSDGLVVGAKARTKQGEVWEGARALSAFLVLGSGRIHVEPVQQPATTNMMATVDVALNLAEGEPPPVVPSLLPPGSSAAQQPAAPQPQAPPPVTIQSKASPPATPQPKASPPVAPQPKASLPATPQPKASLPAILSPIVPQPMVSPSGSLRSLSSIAPQRVVPPPAPKPFTTQVMPAMSVPIVAPPLEAPPIGSSPTAAPPVASSPVASSPVASSPTAAPPVASSPVASSPVASSPVASSASAAPPSEFSPSAAQPSPPPVAESLPSRKTQPSIFRRLAGRGVSRRLTAILIGLAILQGLVVAIALVTFFHRRGKQATAVAPAQSARVARPVAVPKTPPPEPRAPAPSAAASSLLPSPADEPQVHTPSCDDLIAKAPEQRSIPSAAFEQLKLARRALVKGDVEAAQRGYCTAVRFDPQNPNHYFELAQLLLLRKDADAAAHWAKQGVALDPTSVRGQSLLGDALARLSDADGAKRAWFTAAHLIDPTAVQVADLCKRSIQEAEQALIRRDIARAERFFRRAAILDPESAPAVTGLAVALLRLGETRAALRWAERGTALAPRDAKTLVLLADVAAALGDTERAKAQYSAAAALGHPDAAARLKRLK